MNVSRECNVLLFRGCMSQKSARNKRMNGSYSNSVTSDCLERLTDWRESNGRGICTVLLLEWGRVLVKKFAYFSLPCKSPPISWMFHGTHQAQQHMSSATHLTWFYFCSLSNIMLLRHHSCNGKAVRFQPLPNHLQPLRKGHIVIHLLPPYCNNMVLDLTNSNPFHIVLFNNTKRVKLSGWSPNITLHIPYKYILKMEAEVFIWWLTLYSKQ